MTAETKAGTWAQFRRFFPRLAERLPCRCGHVAAMHGTGCEGLQSDESGATTWPCECQRFEVTR